MILLRSALFNLLFVVWTAAVVIVALPTLAVPRAIPAIYRLWRGGIDALMRHLLAIRVRWIGLDRLPAGARIIAAKHQSAWDTIELPWRLGIPAVVIKRELLRIPIYGWFLARIGTIPVDRRGKSGALRQMLARARAEAASGRSILIFPEGTRVAPGDRRPYHPGVAALYGQLGLPVVPIALNSGLVWGRRSFVKRPGTITVEVLPVIPPGLDRRTFIARLEREIEDATARLTNAPPGPC